MRTGVWLQSVGALMRKVGIQFVSDFSRFPGVMDTSAWVPNPIGFAFRPLSLDILLK